MSCGGPREFPYPLYDPRVNIYIVPPWSYTAMNIPEEFSMSANYAAAHAVVREYGLKDSGKRETFSTKAVRDTREGKGRFDLISPRFLRRLAVVLEKGAAKYGDRNWEKGIPLGRYLDSALRHIANVLDGKRDEDHATQAAWNLHAFIHTAEMIEDGRLPAALDDIGYRGLRPGDLCYQYDGCEDEISKP